MLSQTTTTCNVTLENALELNVGLKDHTYHCSEGGPRLPLGHTALGASRSKVKRVSDSNTFTLENI